MREPSVTIRPARSADTQNLAALAIQVWLHTYATSGIREALSAFVFSTFTREIFQQRIEDPQHLLLVAEIDHHLVAYADLDFASPCGVAPARHTELATLYVQEYFAGRGLGSRLMAACTQHAETRCGSPNLWLSVYHLNESAIHFYRKQGFAERGSFFFEFGNEHHNNIIMMNNII
jgi:diamine N-acetyltransferase